MDDVGAWNPCFNAVESRGTRLLQYCYGVLRHVMNPCDGAIRGSSGRRRSGFVGIRPPGKAAGRILARKAFLAPVRGTTPVASTRSKNGTPVVVNDPLARALRPQPPFAFAHRGGENGGNLPVAAVPYEERVNQAVHVPTLIALEYGTVQDFTEDSIRVWLHVGVALPDCLAAYNLGNFRDDALLFLSVRDERARSERVVVLTILI